MFHNQRSRNSKTSAVKLCILAALKRRLVMYIYNCMHIYIQQSYIVVTCKNNKILIEKDVANKISSGVKHTFGIALIIIVVFCRI